MLDVSRYLLHQVVNLLSNLGSYDAVPQDLYLCRCDLGAVCVPPADPVFDVMDSAGSKAPYESDLLGTRLVSV